MKLLTSFDGRIARSDWWTGVLIILAIVMVLNTGLRLALGGMASGDLLSGLAVAAVALYAWAAVLAKRLTDLGLPRMPRMAIFVGAPLAFIAARMAGIGFDEGRLAVSVGTLEDAVVQSPNLLGYALMAAALGAILWAVSECGMRSTPQD